MKRSAIKPKGYAPRPSRQWEGAAPDMAPARATLNRPDGKARLTVMPKAAPLRDESYRRWVSTLACAHCGIVGYSQAAHADAGKSLGIKSSDETCFPLCADRVGVQGCHSMIGSSGIFTRAVRRDLEIVYAAQTQALYKEQNRA